MDKVSGYIVANNLGGYDVIKNTPKSSSKPFEIPILDEDIAKTNNEPDTNKSRDFTITYYDPFKDVKETGSVKLPEWMQTKTTPKRSDAEILKDIEELAKKHANTGEFQDSDPRFKELMDEYISSVSPDRESILRDNISEINERIKMEMYGIINSEDEEKDKKEKEAIDYFIELLKNKGNVTDIDIINSKILTRGNDILTGSNAYSKDDIIATRGDGYYTILDIDRGGGKVTSLVYDNQGNKMPWMSMKGNMYDNVMIRNGKVSNAFFYDDNGEKVMDYNNSHNSNDGLIQLHTNAENSRLKEMIGVYSAAYDFSIGRYVEHIYTNSNNSLYSRAFEGTNKKLVEAYNSTYERLRNDEDFAKKTL